MGLRKYLNEIDEAEVDRRLREYAEEPLLPTGLDELPDNTLHISGRDAASVFTEERIRILGTLTQTPGVSIGGLAKRLDRNRDAVARDLRLLEGHGLVCGAIDPDDKRRRRFRSLYHSIILRFGPRQPGSDAGVVILDERATGQGFALA